MEMGRSVSWRSWDESGSDRVPRFAPTRNMLKSDFFFLSLSLLPFLLNCLASWYWLGRITRSRSAPSARAAPFIQHKKLFDAGHVSHPPEVNRKQIKSILGLEVNEWISFFLSLLFSPFEEGLTQRSINMFFFLYLQKIIINWWKISFLGIFWIFANILAFLIQVSKHRRYRA